MPSFQALCKTLLSMHHLNMKVLVTLMKSDLIALLMEPKLHETSVQGIKEGHKQKFCPAGAGDRIRGGFLKHKEG